MLPRSGRGAIVLCGGQSKRMGEDKASLPIGHETMLQRVVGQLSPRVRQVVVVARSEQVLPVFPENVIVGRDQQENLGPLEGLRVGLESMERSIERVFVCGCDSPLLRAEFVELLFRSAEKSSRRRSDDISERAVEPRVVVPRVGEFDHALAAVYRVRIMPTVRAVLASNRRLMSLLDLLPVQYIEEREMRRVDPKLDSLRNVNQPADYRHVLEIINSNRFIDK